MLRSSDGVHVPISDGDPAFPLVASAVCLLTEGMSDATVLVLGATGKAGRRITPRLRLRGLTVRAASRNSATPFDWSDPGGWDAALRGADAVYIVPPAVPGPVHQLVDRAVAAGVQRLVLQSGHGADVWGDTSFGQDMLSAEQAVRTSDLEWTVCCERRTSTRTSTRSSGTPP
ncbi:SDR family oxidoreductase [Blastococcus montanus]|uniref:SDR family oxidoreductase n=1 Tax=Blastococcus montanus TaxID=3144973 RepID=UPI00387E5D18